MTCRELLHEGRNTLRSADIDDAETDAWLLFEDVFGLDRSAYYLHEGDDAPEAECGRYLSLVRKRASHIPLQQLTGTAWFYGLPFRVREQVLIPRQDTELLVEEVLRRAPARARILDLCTGSGCIIISLLKNLPDASGTATDISGEALDVARENAEMLGVHPDFIRGNLVEHVEGTYDIIVANPPYIPSGAIDSLQEEVRGHEPHLALDGGVDGLSVYRRLIPAAPSYLTEDGFLAMEIGCDQAAEVAALMRKAGFSSVCVKQDLAGLDRVVIGGNSCLTD